MNDDEIIEYFDSNCENDKFLNRNSDFDEIFLKALCYEDFNYDKFQSIDNNCNDNANERVSLPPADQLEEEPFLPDDNEIIIDSYSNFRNFVAFSELEDERELTAVKQ